VLALQLVPVLGLASEVKMATRAKTLRKVYIEVEVPVRNGRGLRKFTHIEVRVLSNPPSLAGTAVPHQFLGSDTFCAGCYGWYDDYRHLPKRG
jgi:hypothetical protein